MTDFSASAQDPARASPGRFATAIGASAIEKSPRIQTPRNLAEEFHCGPAVNGYHDNMPT
jgi:hypothetical protein